jgi:hypothetical protein
MRAYQYDFDGNCRPGGSQMFGNSTFSVGIFQWVPKANGKGLKKSAVVKRVRGYVSSPDKVYNKAREICSILQKEWDNRRV